MTHEQIKKIPRGRGITYARIVVYYRPPPPQKEPNRVHLTAGGDLIQYHGDLNTRTADRTSYKLLWNSMLSTDGAEYMCVGYNFLNLETPSISMHICKTPSLYSPSTQSDNTTY